MYSPRGELDVFKDMESLNKVRDQLSEKEKLERPTFTKGEVVEIKGAPFRVESLGTHLMTLRPMPLKSNTA